jgi:hypothetical protein
VNLLRGFLIPRAGKDDAMIDREGIDQGPDQVIDIAFLMLTRRQRLLQALEN